MPAPPRTGTAMAAAILNHGASHMLFFQSRQWDDAFRWQRTHRFIALIDRLQWDTLQSKRAQDPLHFLIRHELHAPFLADKQTSYVMNSNRFAALHCRFEHRCLRFHCPQGLVQRKARLLGNGLDQNTVMVNDSFVEQDGSRGWNQLLTLVVIPRRFSVANKSAQSRNNDAIVVQKQAVEVVIKEVHGVTVRAYAAFECRRNNRVLQGQKADSNC